MKTTYQIDPSHSSLQFAVRHMMITNVRGNFSGVSGTVIYDPENVSDTTITAEVDASTIYTFDEKRDAHLKSADFLDVEKYPTFTFRSTKVEPSGNDLKVTGDLTIHGETKPVVLTVHEVTPETKDPWGNTRIGASAKGKIDRTEFGLNWNAALEAGGFLVGHELKLDFEVQLIKVEAAAV